jgi:hypothetical protein
MRSVDSVLDVMLVRGVNAVVAASAQGMEPGGMGV